MIDEPVMEFSAEFLVDIRPEVAEAFIVFHRRAGDVKYRLLDWDRIRGVFTAATVEGEAMLRERARLALREGLEGEGE